MTGRRYPVGSNTSETPTEKLFCWIKERHGEEEAKQARVFFNNQKREYARERERINQQERLERKQFMLNVHYVATERGIE